MNNLSAQAEDKQFLIPDSGKHALIRHEFDLAYSGGTVSNLVFSNKGISVDRADIDMNLPSGEYLSEEVTTTFDAKELVLTWNASVPQDTWLEITFRVKGEGEGWSEWYDMGLWGNKTPQLRVTEDMVYGPLKVDIFKAGRDFRLIQYRIRFYGSEVKGFPLLKSVTLCYTKPAEDALLRLMEPPRGQTVSLPVPWLSQFRYEDVEDMDMMIAGVCAPTSVTMVMKFLGKPVRVREIAQSAFDPVAQIHGNWAFLTATAANHGLRAWVQRFHTWHQVRRFVEKATPVIISVAYSKGSFSNEPEAASEGHLMVVRGFTRSGDVIVNNPGTAFREKGDGVVYKWQELGMAFFGHGGVGIIITK
ncbi:MAG TPA: C39 family peptidase [Thermodesulfovibrionia bacterium]|nr:C39 family peptidase [Thermodesulfovibrionia bacterium]